MTAYDYLIPPYQALVDQMVVLTADSDWEVRRAYLASIWASLERVDPPMDAPTELSLIIAGLVERLGEPEIDDSLQAGIYAASAKESHRAASADWFDHHPADFAAIQRRLTGGQTLH
ncbi:hypothetical protein MTBLM5_60164 [Magnetospirillum sp. LM-5]|uniref:hypothetical protein n=1 Tax=Magnetospirillum sp. LM-5 TaxID=2681466 RepID=UPI001384F0A7|nr:hypothetical protein [Magnetospirillum sp. LM-5]CAA7624124.1 hypothetical protein MTBLM5_60164 [Magnetospirillum sp. LM-5]